MGDRLSSIRSRLAELDVDAFFLTSLPSIRWACGFSGSNGALLLSPGECHFITDGRYGEQAHREVETARVHVSRRGLSTYVDENQLLAPFERVAFQAEHLTVAQHRALRDQHPEIVWVPKERIVTRLSASKDDEEVERIRRAQAVTESVFDDILDLIQPEVTEQELAAEITYRHLKQGADKMAFDPIVASGPNAAQPHARPTDRALQDGDMVVLDMGCFVDGYASDMTRTVAIGDPGDAARKGYETVHEAQREALAAARSGLTGQELDRVARDVIEAASLGDYFTHGLGHGIGLQVHEWPRISHTVEDELPSGVCVTIEPGVYVPEEDYGVRIEDIVVLHPDGSENLTQTPKELTSL